MSSERADVDMSPEAVDRRLRELGQLYRLWRSLRECRIIGPVEATRGREGDPSREPSE